MVDQVTVSRHDPRITSLTFSFKRCEKKYVVENGPISKIIDNIHTFFPLALHKHDVFPTVIQTTWCETPDWRVISDYLSRKPFRYKLRVRRYGSNQGFSENCFVEIKSKEELISQKHRFLCPYLLIPEMFEGKDIWKQINPLNNKVTHFDLLYDRVRHMILEEGFRPLLRAKVRRAYFQTSRKAPTRLTLDGFARFTYLPDNRQVTEKFRVVETKVTGEPPEELDVLLSTLNAQRVHRFSKYHRALKIFEPELLDQIDSRGTG